MSLKGLLDASPEAANCCLRVVHRHGAQGPEICRPRWLWRGDTPNLSQSSGVGFWKLSNPEATPSFWFPCQLNFQKKKKPKTNLCLQHFSVEIETTAERQQNVKSHLHTHVHTQRDSDTLLSFTNPCRMIGGSAGSSKLNMSSLLLFFFLFITTCHGPRKGAGKGKIWELHAIGVFLRSLWKPYIALAHTPKRLDRRVSMSFMQPKEINLTKIPWRQ